jgi:hypothetical protein
MNTPMEAKLKLLVDTSSELIDATLYRQIIGSLMYLNKHQTRHLFCREHLESVSGRTQTCSPSGYKTCDEVP